jgi:hypothetical protein
MMGFSLKGFIVILLPLLPNVIFFLKPSQNLPNNLRDGGVFVNILEHGSRIGYYAIMIFITNNHLENSKSTYLFGLLLCLVIYYILWGRYFLKGRNYKLLFESVWGIPIPMAIFPVLYYLLAAIWINNLPAVLAIILFAIGHFINSYITYKQIK